MLRTCSARRNPINVIAVQKMKEQFYVMLRTSNASPGYAL